MVGASDETVIRSSDVMVGELGIDEGCAFSGLCSQLATVTELVV